MVSSGRGKLTMLRKVVSCVPSDNSRSDVKKVRNSCSSVLTAGGFTPVVCKAESSVGATVTVSICSSDRWRPAQAINRQAPTMYNMGCFMPSRAQLPYHQRPDAICHINSCMALMVLVKENGLYLFLALQ